MRSSMLAAALAVVLPLSVNAEEPGDPKSGLEFARVNCSECHAIKSTDDKSPDPNAPAFANIAKTKGMTGRALAVWLQTSHPTMPNLLIGNDDRDDVIAYIMSLQPVTVQ
jgi:mono/diheme cytochrome c family protein